MLQSESTAERTREALRLEVALAVRAGVDAQLGGLVVEVLAADRPAAHTRPDQRARQRRVIKRQAQLAVRPAQSGTPPLDTVV